LLGVHDAGPFQSMWEQTSDKALFDGRALTIDDLSCCAIGKSNAIKRLFKRLLRERPPRCDQILRGPMRFASDHASLPKPLDCPARKLNEKTRSHIAFLACPYKFVKWRRTRKRTVSDDEDHYVRLGDLQRQIGWRYCCFLVADEFLAVYKRNKSDSNTSGGQTAF